MVMSVLDAAYNVGEDYKDGGTAGLARRMDRNPTTLSHELRRTGSAKLGLLDAVKMTALSGDLRILQAFAGKCGQMCVPLPEGVDMDADDCMRRLSAANAAFGKVAAETCDALADGTITANEAARYRRGMGELIASMHALEAAIQSRQAASSAAAGFPEIGGAA